MNLRDLQYIVAVADHKHFGNAAEQCFVSQPTLSMQVKKLEEYLGVTLFERTNKQVFLTPVGEEIIATARTILQEADRLRNIAAQAKDPYAGVVRLGIIPTVAPYLLPRILPTLYKEFPKLELQLHEGQTQAITEQLRHGELDAILLALPVVGEQYEAVTLYEEPFYLAVSRTHPYADRATVNYTALAGQTVLLLEDGHCLRDQALAVCHVVGVQEKANFRATSLETLRQMVASGAGVTLMPELATQYATPGVVYIPFKDPTPTRTIGVVWRKNTARHMVLSKMAECMRG